MPLPRCQCRGSPLTHTRLGMRGAPGRTCQGIKCAFEKYVGFLPCSKAETEIAALAAPWHQQPAQAGGGMECPSRFDPRADPVGPVRGKQLGPGEVLSQCICC